MTNVAVVTCDAASPAEQLTVVGPSGNLAPELGRQAKDVGATSSVATAMNDTSAPRELVAFVDAFAGSVSAGGVVSPAASVRSLAIRNSALSPSAVIAVTAATLPTGHFLTSAPQRTREL